MKLSHRFLAALLALVMVLSLCACGGKTDHPETPGDPQSGSQNNDQPGDNTESTTPKEDTWENAMGQSGVMVYEYKGDKLKKATFKYGNTDKVWRTIEYGSFEDNAVGMRYYETHRNSNNEVTFSLDISYFEEEGAKNVPQHITGHDYFYDETSCDLTLQDDGLIIETMIANTYDGAQDFWITSYASNGLPAKTSVYSREGTLLCTWLFYHEDGRVAYGKEVEDYIIFGSDRIWGSVYKFDYNDNGELVALVEGYGSENSNGEITGFDPKEQHDPENPIGVTFEYDAQGRLSKRIKTGSNIRTTQVFTYSDDDTVAECDFISGRIGSDNDHHTCFKMNSDSVLSSADFGYLSNADTSYYEFEYFDNGMLSRIKAYDRSTVKEGDEYLDIEWENEFYESGSLKTNTTYDSSDMTYYTRYYDEEGEKTDMIGGTYTEDGQKTPD